MSGRSVATLYVWYQVTSQPIAIIAIAHKEWRNVNTVLGLSLRTSYWDVWITSSIVLGATVFAVADSQIYVLKDDGAMMPKGAVPFWWRFGEAVLAGMVLGMIVVLLCHLCVWTRRKILYRSPQNQRLQKAAPAPTVPTGRSETET